ncbi:MAG: transporter [Nitrospirota bacterium]
MLVNVFRMLFIVAGGALLPVTSFAAGLCCQLSSGVQESMSGVAAPSTDQFSLQFTYSLTRMDKLKQGSETRSLDQAAATTPYTSLPVTMDMVKYTTTIGYGFSPDLKAFVAIPYLRNTMDMTMSLGVGMGWMDMSMEPVSGLGDITLMGLYRIYRDREIRPTEAVTVGFGLKTPTGSNTEISDTGSLVHAHMQPGTGSWDPLVSLIYTKMAGSILYQADGTYQYTTKSREGYEFGDSLALNLSGKYAVVKEFNVTAGLTYLHGGKASDSDGQYTDLTSLMDDPANTGGNSLWFSPGIQALPIRNGVIDLKVQVPVWERVNGIQLVSSYRLLLGLSYGF